MYVGKAHSNFVENTEYAPSIKPRPIDARIFTTNARRNNGTVTMVILKTIGLAGNRLLATNQPIVSASIDVIADVTNDANVLPARYGVADLGLMKTDWNT
jgi:hypothetical protein